MEPPMEPKKDEVGIRLDDRLEERRPPDELHIK
jgi:hypothetical protein